MTRTTINLIAILASAATLSGIANVANAGRAKEYFAETYRFKQAMKGVEGQQGAYYCSYRNTPVYKTLPNGKKVKVGYELFQHCY